MAANEGDYDDDNCDDGDVVVDVDDDDDALFHYKAITF